jgi:hypothetical protein
MKFASYKQIKLLPWGSLPYTRMTIVYNNYAHQFGMLTSHSEMTRSALGQDCSWIIISTHANISHLVASQPTSRQQVVFALLVPGCKQTVNNL